jgi:diguanylate cyclase
VTTRPSYLQTRQAKEQLALVVPALGFVGMHLAMPGSAKWADLLFNLTFGVATFLMASRARRLGRRGRPWAWLAVGLASYTIGGVYETASNFGWVEMTDPSWSDAFWLGFYPCAIAGAVGMIRSQPRRLLSNTWLDGLVSGLGALAINAALAFDTTSAAVSTDPIVTAVTLAYPVGDVLLALLIVAGLGGWRRNRSVGLLLAGFLLLAGGDTMFIANKAGAGYHIGAATDFVWLAAAVALGLSATVGLRVGARSEWADDNNAVFPLTFALAALGLLILDRFRPIDTIAVVLAALTIVAIGFRAKVALQALGELADTRREARTDELTSLPNRRSFTEMIGAALESASLSESPLAIVMVDLDGFKVVNDTLGHHRGDELLREVAHRFNESLSDGDVLARLGGDEFGLVVHPRDQPGWAYDAARRLHLALEKIFEIDGLRLHVKGSVGVALHPQDGDTPEILLQRADVAMYEAKRSNGGVRFYSAEFDRNSREQLQQLDELRDGIIAGQLVLHYQPKVRFSDGIVTGVEALVRWQHPVRGLLGPGQFLPVAVAGGLLPQLTRQIITMAIEQAGRWRADGRHLGVAVNVGSADLMDEAFPDMIGSLVRRNGLPSGMLTIEITEDSVIEDPVRTANVVAMIRSMGIKVSIDDFGAGYASLSHLRELDVDELKLDKSLVDNVETDVRQQALVQSAVGMAHALGLNLVAEGVETIEAWNQLKLLNCDVVQGYLVSRPLAEPALCTWLDEHQTIQEATASVVDAVGPPVASGRRSQRRRSVTASGWRS